MILRRRPVRLLLLVLIASLVVAASRDEAAAGGAVRSAVLAIRQGDSATGRALLDSLQLSEGETGPDAALAAGFLSLEQGDSLRAIQYLTRAYETHSLLYGYAAFALAELARARGDTIAVVELLEELDGAVLPPRRFRFARYLLGDALVSLGRDGEAARALREVAESGVSDSLSRQAHVRLAAIAVRAGDAEEAQRWLRSVQRRFPTSGEAGEAEEAARRLAEESGVPAPPETAREILDRGQALERAGRLSDARELYQRVEESGSAEEGFEARWRRAGTERKSGRTERAERLIHELLDTMREGGPEGGSPQVEYARLEALRIALARKKSKTAREWWALLLREAPASGSAHQATLELASRQESDGDVKDAAATYRAWLSENEAHDGAGRVRWELARLDRLDGNTLEAALLYDELATHDSRGYAAAALFWSAWLYGDAGDTTRSTARARLLRLRYPHTWYGERILLRFPAENLRLEEGRGTGRDFFDRSRSNREVAEEVFQALPPSNPTPGRGTGLIPGYERARSLFEIGFSAWAYEELEPFVLDVPAGERDERMERALLAAALDGELWSQGIAAAGSLHGEELANGRAKDPDLLWRVAYPRPYSEAVREAAEAVDIDPILVWAVSRRESAFNPDAVSRVGAIGLLQLMPETARQLLGRRSRGPRPEDLRDPAFNLKLGARYLAQLVEKWPDRLDVALAAYNAGPTRAKRWLEEWGDEPVESFVDAIPFTETRMFVKAVLLNQVEYRRLYESERPAESSGRRDTTSASTPQGTPAR